MFPVVSSPDLDAELATITPMYDGSCSGGFELLPGSADQVPPQVGRVVLKVLAKPLKSAGAGPPLREFNLDHLALQKVTDVLRPALKFPITKEP